MVDQSDTFLREVDEELRREQIQQFIQRYGILIAAGALLLLAGIGGYKVWDSGRIAASEAAGSRFATALQAASAGKADDALKQFDDLAKTSPSGYRALTQMQLAGAQVKAGKPEIALPLYEGLGRDTSIDPLLRDYAALQAALLRLDAADWTEMQNRLTPLMSDGSAWRAMARETLGLAAYKAGQSDEARKLFEQVLGDRMTPPSVSERALLMLALLTDAEVAKNAAKPGETAKPAEAMKPGEPAKNDTGKQAPPPKK